ncbi:MAG TPA: response regulator transcription factor [Prolixibacteraceae bacterium]|nr:response regulator transcription factor [Prolixibacteraceae bacterium]
MSIRILIADDHQLFREGIANLLSASPQIEIVAQAENGQEAIEKAKNLKPDIIIMDLSMPVINGVDATRILHKELPEIRVLVLSMHCDKHYIKEGLEAGASGYLFKNCTYDQLIEAVNTVYQGKKYLSDKITEVLIQDYLSKEEKVCDNSQKLSERESEILKLKAEGKSTREISDILFISVKTVGTHKQHILEKLNLKSTADLIKYAIKKGIVGLG